MEIRKYIFQACKTIFIIIAITFPVFVGGLLWIITPLVVSHFHMNWEMLDIHMPTEDVPLSFSPAHYIMSLAIIQKIISSSGFPTVLGFFFPILIDGIVAMIIFILIYGVFILGGRSISGFFHLLLRIASFFLFVPRMLWRWMFGESIGSAFLIWIKRYGIFLWRYALAGDIWHILLTHGASFKHVFLPRTIPLLGSGKEYHTFFTPFEDRALVESFNTVLSRIFGGEGNRAPYVGEFTRNKGELTFSILRGDSHKLLSDLKKVQEYEREFTIEMGNGIFKMLTPQENQNGLKVKIVTRYDWKSQEVTANEFEGLMDIQKSGEILLGFLPKTINGANIFVPYKVNIQDVGHAYIGASSTNGKDGLVRSIVLSILVQSPYRKSIQEDTKKIGESFEVTFIDTKESDGAYLIGVPGFSRIVNSGDQVAVALEKCVSEMEKRLGSFGVFGNIDRWNKKNLQRKFSHQYVIINEINDLLSASEKSVYARIIKATRSLSNRGLAGGFHILLMGQSLRKEDSEIGSLLTNISTRFIGKMGNEDEEKVALKRHYKNFINIEKYNFVHLQDGESKEMFRPYLTDQENISEWIDQNFDRVLQSDSEINVPREEVIMDDKVGNHKKGSYLDNVDFEGLMEASHEIKSLPRDLAMRFGVPEKKFPELKTLLVSSGILEVREGMVARINPHLTIDEILLKTKNIKNNQE